MATETTTRPGTSADRPNGIDVAALSQTVATLQDDPSLGDFTFRASSTWEDGTCSRGSIHTFAQAGQEDTTRTTAFVLHGDEPPALLGQNRGPNAVELLLQSLAFCYAVGFAANAAALGITLTRMDHEVEGDINVGRFLGLDGTRPGFTAIRAHAYVSSPDATPEQLQELGEHVQRTSPVLDCLTEPVPVQTTVHVV